MLNQHGKECRRCLVLAKTQQWGKARKVEMQVPGGKAGCRWKSPAWYPSLDSAPQVTSPAYIVLTPSIIIHHHYHCQVEISEDRLVTIAWTEEQLMENRACTDLFEVKDFTCHLGKLRKVRKVSLFRLELSTSWWRGKCAPSKEVKGQIFSHLQNQYNSPHTPHVTQQLKMEVP